jgi:hypothetical protein
MNQTTGLRKSRKNRKKNNKHNALAFFRENDARVVVPASNL